MYTRSGWKEICNVDITTKHPVKKGELLIDKNGKEWFVFVNILHDHPSQHWRDSSYLYDIKKNQFCVFEVIKNASVNPIAEYYLYDHIARFYDSFVTDNENHVMYLLVIDKFAQNDGYYCHILKIDIKNVKHATVIDTIEIKDEKSFISQLHLSHDVELNDDCNDNENYQIFLINYYQIHFIAGFKHFILNLKSGKFDLIDENILMPHKIGKNLPNKLNIGMNVDIRDTWFGIYYSATIIDIKPKAQSISREKDWKLYRLIETGLKDKSILQSYKEMKGIYVQYNGWSEESWNEWIYYDENDKNNNLYCDCKGLCHKSKYQHRIALHETQSILQTIKKNESKNGRISRKMIHFKDDKSRHNDKLILISNCIFNYHNNRQYNMVYSFTNHERFQIIVYGYLRLLTALFGLYMPKDLCNVVHKYYFDARNHIKWNPIFNVTIPYKHAFDNFSCLLLDNEKQDLLILSDVKQQYEKKICIFNVNNSEFVVCNNSKNDKIYQRYMNCSLLPMYSKQSATVYLFARNLSHVIAISIDGLI